MKMKYLFTFIIATVIATTCVGRPVSNSEFKDILTELSTKTDGDNTGVWQIIQDELKPMFEEESERIFDNENVYNKYVNMLDERFENWLSKIEDTKSNFNYNVIDTFNNNLESFKKAQHHINVTSLSKPRYKDVEKLIEDMKEPLQSRLENIKDQIQSYSDRVDNMNNTLTDVEQQILNLNPEEFKSNVEIKFKEFIKEIGEHYEPLKNKVRDLIKDTDKRIQEIGESDNQEEMLNEIKTDVISVLANITHQIKIIVCKSNTYQLSYYKAREEFDEINDKIKCVEENMKDFSWDMRMSMGMDTMMVETEMQTIVKMSSVTVFEITETGENELGYEDHIPYIGLSPGEYMISISISNYDYEIVSHVTKDGKSYKRKITKTQIDDYTDKVTEIFYSGSQVESEKNYTFKYDM